MTTFVWFSQNNCNRAQPLTIGKFHKKNKIWQQKLIKIDKYKTFHNCELVYGLPIDRHTHLHYITRNEPHGVYMDILYHAIDYYDIKFHYQPIHLSPEEGIVLIQLGDGNLRTPNIFMIPMPISESMMAATTSFYQDKSIFMVSPALLYTPFEKLFLPFDHDTWMLLLITFGAAFVVIFIINFSARWLNDIVYGYRVSTPSLNILGTFFGISQTQLPTGWFARIILMSFILFCLVMRTAYQGVQFDMMTREMRRPQIEKISDIWREKFEVFCVKGLEYEVERIDGWEK